MRFAHLSDTHLGYKHLAKDKREHDFYEQFQKTIDRIIEEEVDFVIHSGDLFDQSPPHIEPLKAFQDGLLKLKEAEIPMYAIAGNHDIKYIKDKVIPQILFENYGLKIISAENPYYYEGDVLICGVPHQKKSKSEELKESLLKLSQEAENAEKSILVLHQGVLERFPEYLEIKMDELPENFDYYAMGHLHNFFELECGRGKLVYPGSMEFVRSDVKNYDMSGKGFCIVDISDDDIKVDRIILNVKRELIIKPIQYDNLKEEIEGLYNHISSLDNEPLVFLEVKGEDFDLAEVREYINSIIKDKCLHLDINLKRDIDSNDMPKIQAKSLNPLSLLKEKIDEKYNDEKITNLSLDLLDTLSKGEIKNAEILSEDFYKENYFISENDEAIGDIDEDSVIDEAIGDIDEDSVIDELIGDMDDDSINDENYEIESDEISLDDFKGE